MTLVPAKCPECGGNVVVDNEKDAWICDFCKTPFIVEKAINNFNTINNTVNNVTNNINAEVVHVYDSKEKDFVIVSGVLKEYRGISSDIVIPDEVTSMGGAEGLFDVRSITFGGGMDTISAMPHMPRLEKVVFSEKVTKVGKDAFRQNSSWYRPGPETVIFSDSILEIDDRAFEECSKLTDLVLPQRLRRIGVNTFKNCESIGEEIIIPESVQEIDAGAFQGCKLKRVIIKNPDIQIDSVGVFGYQDKDTYPYNYVDISGIEFIGYDRDALIEKQREKNRRAFLEEQDSIKKIVQSCREKNTCPACGKPLSLLGKCKHYQLRWNCKNFEKRVFDKKTGEVRDGIAIRYNNGYVYKNGDMFSSK